MDSPIPSETAALVLALSAPDAREVLRAYSNTMAREYEPVLKSLQEAHPVILESTISRYLQTVDDPVALELDDMQQVSSLEMIVGLLPTHEDATQSTKDACAQAHNAALYRRALHCEVMRFYVDLVKSANAVAEREHIAPTEAVQREPYLTQVLKDVFPTREKAEAFWLGGLRIDSAFKEAAVKVFEEFETLDGPIPPHIRRKLPTLEAAADIFNANLRYNGRMIDTIYGPK